MDIKRVNLSGKSRSGYFWRVSLNGIYRYYKYRQGFTKEQAIQIFTDSISKTKSKSVREKASEIFPKKPKAVYPKEEEGVTVHFRVDYAKGQFHHTQMKFTETYVQLKASDIKGLSNSEIIEEATERLGDFWAYTVGWDNAKNVITGIEESEVITGLSDGGGNKINIKTKYGVYSGTHAQALRGIENKHKEDYEFLSKFK